MRLDLSNISMTCEALVSSIASVVATYKAQYSAAYGVDVTAFYVSSVTCTMARGSSKTIPLTRAQGGRRTALQHVAADYDVQGADGHRHGSVTLKRRVASMGSRSLQQAGSVLAVDLSLDILMQLTDTAAVQRMAQLQAAQQAVDVTPFMQVGACLCDPPHTHTHWTPPRLQLGKPHRADSCMHGDSYCL